MKTITTKLTVLLFLATFVSSCGIDMFNRVEGNRNVVIQNRKINNDFTKVKVSSGLDLYISTGDKVSLTVEADENLQDIIITEVKGDQLRIYTDKGIYRAKSRKIYLTVPNLEELKATSGSDVFSENVLQVNTLTVSTTSGADMNIKVDATSIISSSSSGADLKIAGKTATHNSKASSGSSINAYNLESKDVTVSVSSGADISIYASESIDAKASSGGDIRYRGNPKTVNKKTSSGGGVSAR